MIRSHLRAGLALACALSLSACGGGDGDVYIGGTVTGVTKPGLVLQNNGGSDLPIETSGPFSFKDLVDTDSRYNVTVKSKPENVEKIEDCVVTNGTGRAVFNVSTVIVSCTIWQRPLGGTIVGLNGAPDLVLVNGTDRVAITPAPIDPATNTYQPQPFQMAKVSQDSPYGVTILKQPTGRSCTVENGTGTMPAAEINTIVVRCTPTGSGA